jgi:hypothetical protein
MKDETNTPPENAEKPADSPLPSSEPVDGSAPNEPDIQEPVAEVPQEEPDELQVPLEPEQPVVPAATPFYKRKPVLIAAAVLLVLGVGAALWLTVFSKPAAAPQQSAVQKQSLLGATATVVDGTAEASTNNTTWTVLKADTTLQQGTYIRTNETGRVVVTLDDGSAVRVNSNSTVRLASLATTSVVVHNLAGEVYTRVVKSERSFSVGVGDESYVALGTAYKTINTETVKGVEVYESQVKAKTAKQDVPEGKRYYQVTPTAELSKKVADIPLDQLQKDDFLKWNLEHDKKATEFKDKLGYLATLEKTPAPAPAPAPTPVPAPTPAAGISLSGKATSTGVSLSWKLTGVSATKGFKILKSKTTDPTYGKSDGTYVSDSAARSYNWTIKDGKTYYFRICTYTGDACTNYSNSVKLTTPYVAPTPPTGTLSLVHNGGNSFGWTLNGSAPYGHKLVWSTSPGPTYPGSNAKFYDKGSTTSATIDADSGSYYVRVCMYYEGACMNYSNEVSVTIP